jgi:hypothetical protein
MGLTANSRTLLDILRKKHAEDVFVSECHMAESGSQRLDAWVLRKTWSPLTTIGYEIKVSRMDFVHDDKWTLYLRACLQFYWVCPPRLIAVEEVPEGCGLMWQAGSRLLTKRKAPRHEPDPTTLILLMAYVLMSRSQIVANMWEAGARAKADVWRDLMLEREGERLLGHVVGKVMRRHVQDLERRTREAAARSQSFEHLEKRLREAGVDPSEPEAFAKANALLRATAASSELDQIKRGLVFQARQIMRLAGVSE